MKFDVCIVGSGAGAGPVAYQLSKAGYKVVILEKGPWFKTEDFAKDEMVATRRDVYTPRVQDECTVLERGNKEKGWTAKSTRDTGINFWNGNMVGGSSNLMSAYFHRMKPNDFRLKSEYGEIKEGNVVDWPISYNDLEPYYSKVEEVIGVSGKVTQHKFLEPRSTPEFPYPPLQENIVASWIDKAANELNIETFPTSRGVLSLPKENRKNCYLSGYCGSYGCSSDAKGSARVALLNQAIATGNCTILPNSKVFLLEEEDRRVKKVHFYNLDGKKEYVEAKITVVAAQAIESARLLLMSKNKNFPNGLGNNNGQVGKNLVFSAGGTGSGIIDYDTLSEKEANALKQHGLWVNRATQHWYEIEDEPFKGKVKGGTVDFVFEHSNGVTKAFKQKYDEKRNLVFGSELKNKLLTHFTKRRRLNFEIFIDWTPNDNCYVTLDEKEKDKWGDPVAKVRLGYNKYDLEVGGYIAKKTEAILIKMGAHDVKSGVSGTPPSNLQAGGCRFGDNPKKSVLDKNCKSHEVDNLYVTDGSFMPTGGSTTFTFTIYANSFRVADKIKKRLDDEK